MNNEKGQAIVEMALLIPVLLLILVAIFDFGRIFYTNIHLEMAAQETVRLGGLGKTDSEMINFAQDYVNVDPASLTIQITPDDVSRSSGEYVTVQFQYPVHFVTPLIDHILPSDLSLSAKSTIRVE